MDPKPSEPWVDRALTREELAELRTRLERMSDHDLLKFYEAAHSTSRLDRGRGPRAPFLQQLVVAWRVMRKRGLAG